MSAGGGYVPSAQRLSARIIGQEVGNQMVAGSLRAGDGLGEERSGVGGVDKGVAQQIRHEALAQQDIIA
jgi:hypothetical protein